MSKYAPQTGPKYMGITKFPYIEQYLEFLKLTNYDNYDTLSLKIGEDVNMMKSNIKSCSNDSNQGSIFEETLYKLNSISAGIMELKQKHNVNFICQNGCGKCCIDYFYISIPEYLIIRDELIRQGILETMKEKANLEYINLKYSNSEEYIRLETTRINESKIKEYFNDKKYPFTPEKCLLMDENNSCMIYDKRPIICRLHGISLYYNICDKVRKKCTTFWKREFSFKKAKKYLIPLKLDDSFHEFFDVIPYHGKNHILRPYPLIYYLTHDDEFKKLYELSLSSKEKYIKYLIDSKHILI